ncbi:hypothetical protein, partial [Putridiphycobacter roseus]
MSYVIDFIKTKKLDFDNVYNLLEGTVNPTSEIFIGTELMNKIVQEIEELGFEFEMFKSETEDHCELNFSTYQVAMFNTEIAISLPYWDSNINEGTNKEIKQIINILLENGFSGFDSQTEEFITEAYQFKSIFSEAQTHVNQNENSHPSVDYSLYLGLGIGLVLLCVIIWKTINKKR